MTRAVEEVVASQRAMVERLGTKAAELASEQLARGLKAHRDETLAWIRRAPHMEILEVEYPSLIRDPASVIARLVEFLGPDRLTAPERMPPAVDASLYRRRGSR
jgi:LPS sulfotransferase NodH